MPPKPLAFKIFSSSTSTFITPLANCFLASSAKSFGTKSSGGVFTKSRARFTLSTKITAFCNAFLYSAESGAWISAVFKAGLTPALSVLYFVNL